jgi:hypothetical protein
MLRAARSSEMSLHLPGYVTAHTRRQKSSIAAVKTSDLMTVKQISYHYMKYNNSKMCSKENTNYSEITVRELTLMNKHHNVTIYT